MMSAIDAQGIHHDPFGGARVNVASVHRDDRPISAERLLVQLARSVAVHGVGERGPELL